MQKRNIEEVAVEFLYPQHDSFGYEIWGLKMSSVRVNEPQKSRESEGEGDV